MFPVLQTQQIGEQSTASPHDAPTPFFPVRIVPVAGHVPPSRPSKARSPKVRPQPPTASDQANALRSVQATAPLNLFELTIWRTLSAPPIRIYAESLPTNLRPTTQS